MTICEHGDVVVIAQVSDTTPLWEGADEEQRVVGYVYDFDVQRVVVGPPRTSIRVAATPNIGAAPVNVEARSSSSRGSPPLDLRRSYAMAFRQTEDDGLVLLDAMPLPDAKEWPDEEELRALLGWACYAADPPMIGFDYFAFVTAHRWRSSVVATGVFEGLPESLTGATVTSTHR